jgi:hypothetical protein
MLIKLENGSPVGHPVLEANFRMLHPDTSFPAVLTPELVAPFGFGMFEYSQIPEPAHHYDKAVEAPAIRDAQGVWRQVWELVPMSEAERLKADHDQAAIMRHARDMALTRSDFSQMADAPSWVDQAAWAQYRQALRDVPQQGGFPWQVSWPEPPILTAHLEG